MAQSSKDDQGKQPGSDDRAGAGWEKLVKDTFKDIQFIYEQAKVEKRAKQAIGAWAKANDPADRIRKALLSLAHALDPFCSAPAPPFGGRPQDGDVYEATVMSDVMSAKSLHSLAELERRFDQLAEQLAPLADAAKLLTDPVNTPVGKYKNLKEMLAISLVTTKGHSIPAEIRQAEKRISDTSQEVKTHVSDTSQEVKTRVSDTSQEVKAHVTDTSQEVKAHVSDTSQEVKTHVSDTSQEVKTHVSESYRDVVSAIQAASEGQAEALRQALAERSERQPVAVDAGAVGDRLLECLADSEQARRLFARAADSYLDARCKNLELMLLDLPRLFDAVEWPLETWDDGRKLTEAQRACRDEVLGVLREIHKQFDAWKVLHQIEALPDPKEGPLAYDPGWHIRVKTTPTADPAQHGTVARVIELGYRWQGERVRKAEVVVYRPAEDGDAPVPIP